MFSATDWVVVWCIPTLLARRGKIPLVAEYGDKVAAAVSSAALEQPGAGMLAVVGGGLRCAAVEIPLRYHALPTEAELVRMRDDDDYCAPCVPRSCTHARHSRTPATHAVSQDRLAQIDR